jgi:hypothetical protein
MRTSALTSGLSSQALIFCGSNGGGNQGAVCFLQKAHLTPPEVDRFSTQPLWRQMAKPSTSTTDGKCVVDSSPQNLLAKIVGLVEQDIAKLQQQGKKKVDLSLL